MTFAHVYNKMQNEDNLRNHKVIQIKKPSNNKVSFF